jgi:hypothetical protein
MSGHQPQNAGSVPQNGSGMNMPSQPQTSGPPPAQNAAQQNLNQIVSTSVFVFFFATATLCPSVWNIVFS